MGQGPQNFPAILSAKALLQGAVLTRAADVRDLLAARTSTYPNS